MVWNYCSRIVLYSVGGKELTIIGGELSLSHPTAIELQLLQFQESDLFHNWVMHGSSSGRNSLSIAVDFGSSEQDLDGTYYLYDLEELHGNPTNLLHVVYSGTVKCSCSRW